MNIQETYDYITANMSAEDALKKLLEGHIRTYEHLKFNEGEELHPLMVVTLAALDMGWSLAVPDGKDDDEVQGMMIGTDEYINGILKYNDDDCDKCDGHCDCDKEE